MRLIDADNLMEQVKAIHKAVDTSEINNDYNTGFHSATSQIQGLIAFMPTAYNVDKAVEELEDYREEARQFGVSGMLTDIIEIVRKGGAV